MGKKAKWFGAVKKVFSPEKKSKQKKVENHKSNKWGSNGVGKFKDSDPSSSESFENGGPNSAPPPSQPQIDVKLAAAHIEQSKHAHSVAVASQAAADAAVASAQAAAEVVRLTVPARFAGKSREEIAAIKIQTAFRGYLARRALRALRGLVRLKSLIHGNACKRQATTTLRCMQTLARVQSQIRSRRIRMSEDNQALQRQLLLKREKELESLRVRQLEKFLEEGKDELLDESFHQKVTEEFNSMPNRSGKKAIQIKQVQEWFEKKKCTGNEVTEALNSPQELVLATDTGLSNTAASESSDDMPEDPEEKHTDQEDLEFEAKSSRDNAWYDVATFLAHRMSSSGEPEVRVRFHGFGAEDDEWVNIKKDVRQRSIPVESSECRKVEVGDLVLCFRERNEQAMYFDAHVTNIERKLHDIRGCRCHFMIKYDHDGFEEKINVKRICRRPEF